MQQETKVLLTCILCIFVTTCSGMKPFQLRYKISKAKCAPIKGFENKILPCYDFKTKNVVDPKDCGLKRNKHCCIHDCKCIIRGAGTEVIPKAYRLPQTKLKKPFKTIKECTDTATQQPGSKTNDESASTTPKPQDKTISTNMTTTTVKPTSVQPPTSLKTQEYPTSKPSLRKPMLKPPTPRKTISQIASKSSLNKQPRIWKSTTKQSGAAKTPPVVAKQTSAGNKFARHRQPKGPTKPKRYNGPIKSSPSKTRNVKTSRRPTVNPKTQKVQPTKKTKKPCTTTKKNEQSFSFSFFTRMASLLDGFGFQAEVVPNNDC